ILWLDNNDTGDKFVFSEVKNKRLISIRKPNASDRNSPYTIIDRVHIDEIITDASGGVNSDINSDDELVENEEVSEEDSTNEPPTRAFVSTRSGNSATRLELF
ncbi:unnamed protein product, partial [Pocillopora meandrina]